MASDAGVLPDKLDSGLGMDKRPGADVFGASIEVALQRGSAAREGKALKDVACLADRVHGQA